MTENAIKCRVIQLLTENSNLTISALKALIQAFSCSITVLFSYNNLSKIDVPIRPISDSLFHEL
jgi:hypothetical protein